MKPITFIVMRHGQSVADLIDCHEGRANLPLTELGEKQVKRSIERIIECDNKVTRIYSSPLERARRTAQFCEEKMNVKVIEDDRLMEWNNGDLAGLKKDEAREKFPLPKGGRRGHHTYANTESMIEFRARLESFLSELIEIHEKAGGTILIVCHGGTIQMLFRSFFQLPFDSNQYVFSGDGGYHKWKLDNTKRIYLELFPGH
ncbi:histidine phosphatase family protein [Bacillus shivajii]|uniref:histidine phosphatase family protein n=1 Tax=Bacillus shivajii TaxID=1983719 RepID=UPI001CFABEAE|nr:histidine phosphatase family protein [Bacillus shivajii]UCZ52399.1 histidine phosphatase family protein [Bacillus shivajii]